MVHSLLGIQLLDSASEEKKCADQASDQDSFLISRDAWLHICLKIPGEFILHDLSNSGVKISVFEKGDFVLKMFCDNMRFPVEGYSTDYQKRTKSRQFYNRMWG